MKNKIFQLIVAAALLPSLTAFAAAQNKVVPIFHLSVGDAEEVDSPRNYGELLGGVENGKWLDAKTTFGKLKGDEKISLYHFESGKKGEISPGKINVGPDVCQENYYVEPDTKIAADLGVGTSATWNAMPRVPKSFDGNAVAEYKKAVADVLKSKGLSKSPVKIEQADRVDLDGDGVDEVVLVADLFERDENSNPKKGNYSFVMIRKIIKGKAQTIYVTGNFDKKDYDGGAHTVAAIADLNGDGKMEIVVRIYGYSGEEHWMNTFEIKSGKPTEVKALYFYCGV